LTIVRKRKKDKLPLEVKEEVAKRRRQGELSAATINNRMNGLHSQRELGVEQEKLFPEEHAVLITQAIDNARRNHSATKQNARHKTLPVSVGVPRLCRMRDALGLRTIVARGRHE
jgi:hypothetical protein